jgi:hypothetical protein
MGFASLPLVSTRKAFQFLWMIRILAKAAAKVQANSVVMRAIGARLVTACANDAKKWDSNNAARPLNCGRAKE